MLTKKIIATYIKQADFSKISQQYANSNNPIDIIKKYLKIASHLCMQGYRDAKIDIQYFAHHYKSTDLSLQDRLKIERIKIDLLRLPPVAILFCLPLGFPLVFGYLTFFPNLTPTWVQTDKHLTQDTILYNTNKNQALKFFLKTGTIYKNSSNILQTHINSQTFPRMSLPQQKKVAQLCFGLAKDGTNIIRYFFKIRFQYFISENFSSFILRKFFMRAIWIQEPYMMMMMKQGSIREIDPITVKVLEQANFIMEAN